MKDRKKLNNQVIIAPEVKKIMQWHQVLCLNVKNVQSSMNNILAAKAQIVSMRMLSREEKEINCS